MAIGGTTRDKKMRAENRTQDKYLVILVATALVTVTLFSDTALALGSGPPSDDSYVDVNNADTSYDDDKLEVRASASGCTPVLTTYLKWNLSDVSTSIHTATLTLTTVDVSNTSEAKLTLYAVEDTYVGTTVPWEEEGLTYNNAPTITLSAAIETQDAPTAMGQVVTFNSTALRDYVNSQAAGDDTASFALRFSSDCASGLTIAVFEDREAETNSPDLRLLNLNAVRWHSLQANGPTSGWALVGILGLFALPAVGRVITRRFTRQENQLHVTDLCKLPRGRRG